MARNNLSAFLDSIDLGKPHITCPACGNNMALRDMASYRMALTDNARDELNRAVQAFRNILTTIEAELARINRFGIARPTIKETDYPHDYEIKTIYPGLKPDGTYSDSVGAEAVKELITTLDVLEFTKYFHEIPWPPHSHSPLFNNKDKNADDIKKVLINGAFCKILSVAFLKGKFDLISC